MAEAPRLNAQQRAQYDWARRAWTAMQSSGGAAQSQVHSFERDRRTSSGVVVHETVREHARRRPRAELRNVAPRPSDPFMGTAAAEQAAAGLGRALAAKNWRDAALNAAELAVVAVPGAVPLYYVA